MTEMDQTLVTRIVEAALMAANQPLTVVQLGGLFPLDEPAPDNSIAVALEQLQAACAERGVELVEVASGWRFQVKEDVHPWVARLWTERQTRYTRATLETLALIAYRQPITRGEIEQVRGVAVNSNIIKALEEREWIRVVGHRDVPGKPELLATTKTFLDYFGLKRLDELPPLSELKDIGELEPQLPFDPAIPAGVAAGAGREVGPEPASGEEPPASEPPQAGANPATADTDSIDTDSIDPDPTPDTPAQDAPADAIGEKDAGQHDNDRDEATASSEHANEQ
ncbi:SMC-Scp complex subunit ScpB [Thermomonas brevis]